LKVQGRSYGSYANGPKLNSDEEHKCPECGERFLEDDMHNCPWLDEWVCDDCCRDCEHNSNGDCGYHKKEEQPTFTYAERVHLMGAVKARLIEREENFKNVSKFLKPYELENIRLEKEILSKLEAM
jgi:hypothetical protein